MHGDRTNVVNRMDAYKRLFAVTSSALFGEAMDLGGLFPAGSDALTTALQTTQPWTVPVLTAAAQRIAVMGNDCGLVTLAAFPGDPVVLAALRESVVLYVMMGATLSTGQPPRYDWQVDPELAERAGRFVATFNELFPRGPALPEPTASNAEQFWVANHASRIAGRCVRIGNDQSGPPRYYHWGIRIVNGFTGPLEVDEFWSDEVWTTERYRQSDRYLRPYSIELT